MKFGRVRFRVKKLVITNINAVDGQDKNSPRQPNSARNSSRVQLDIRLSEMSIGQDT